MNIYNEIQTALTALNSGATLRLLEKVRDENATNADESQQKKNRRKEWLDWYGKSKSEKE